MKRWTKRIALLLVGTLVGLLIAEGAVRVAGLGGTALNRGVLHGYDAQAGWKCAANLDAHYSQPGSFNVHVKCNSRGLRDSEKDFSKPAGTQRIVVLGDSFMWGYGVEDTEMFSSILEDKLPGTETINLGVSGYSTVQELIRLETEGLRYDPDWVVLAFCWNDLEDNFDDKRGGRPVVVFEENQELKIVNRPVRRQWKSPVKQWFRHHSRLFTFGEYYNELLRRKLRQIRRRNDAGPPDAASVAAARKPKDAMKFSFFDIYDTPRPEIDQAYLAFRLLLEKIQDHLRKDGRRLVVTYSIPREVVEKKIFYEFMQVDPSDSVAVDRYDWDRPARRLGEICAALSIPYVDPSLAFREHANPSVLFLTANHHWSAKGHRLAAEKVAAKIKELDTVVAR